MDTDKHTWRGLRLEIPQGTDEGVAIDELVDDLLRGDIRGALRALHELNEIDRPGDSAPA